MDRMHGVHSLTLQAEPQESSGRWRASTYNSLRPPESSDHDLVDFIVKSFFRALHDVFTSTARRSHVLHSRTVFVDFRAEATRIAMQALRWRDAVATSCYGHDYTAFYVWPLVRLDAKDFELDSPPPKMSSHTASARSSTAVEVVVLTTSLGLCASTNVPRMGGAFHRNGATLKAAKGFAADFAKLSVRPPHVVHPSSTNSIFAATQYRTGGLGSWNSVLPHAQMVDVVVMQVPDRPRPL